MKKKANDDSHYWQYRVVRTVYKTKIRGSDYKETVYDIREVYFENNKPVALSQSADHVQGETMAELRSDLKHYASALEKPILDEKDFPCHKAARRPLRTIDISPLVLKSGRGWKRA